MKAFPSLLIAALFLSFPPGALAQSGERCGVFAFDPQYCGVRPNFYTLQTGTGPIVCAKEFQKFCAERGLKTRSEPPRRKPARKAPRTPASEPRSKPAAVDPSAPAEPGPLSPEEAALLTSSEKAAYDSSHDDAKYRALSLSRAGYRVPASQAQFAALSASQRELFCDRYARSAGACAAGSAKSARPAMASLMGAKNDASAALDGAPSSCAPAQGANAWAGAACKLESSALPAAASSPVAKAPPPPSPKLDSERGLASAESVSRTGAPRTAAETRPSADGKSETEAKPHKGLLRKLFGEIAKFGKWLW